MILLLACAPKAPIDALRAAADQARTDAVELAASVARLWPM